MSRVRIAVIGAGHLGSIHARLAPQTRSAQLVAVVDPSAEARQKIAAHSDVPCLAEWASVADAFDAAIVATPTSLHHRIGLELIGRGKHVLIEKPLAATADQADQLVAAAQQAGVVLQVGHVERFNPALTAALPQMSRPRYLSAVRQGRYTGRSMDVGVVLDLMIHDLDVILSLVRQPVESVAATGAAVLGPHEDVAEARLTFAGGAVANLTASRISRDAQRRLQVDIDSPTRRVTVDFGSKAATVEQASGQLLAQASSGSPPPSSMIDELYLRHLVELPLEVTDSNAIADEQRDFVDSILQRREPTVTGRDGRDALLVAQQILQSIARHQQQLASHRTEPPLRRAG